MDVCNCGMALRRRDMFSTSSLPDGWTRGVYVCVCASSKHGGNALNLRAIRPDLPQPASDPSLGAAMPLGETYPESGLHLESNGTKSRITPSRDAVLPDAPPSVHQESCTSSRSLDADMGCRRPASTPERQHLSSIDVDPRAESVELAKTRAAEDAAMMSKLNRAFWT